LAATTIRSIIFALCASHSRGTESGTAPHLVQYQKLTALPGTAPSRPVADVNSPQGPPRAWWLFPDNMVPDKSANAKILDRQIFRATHSPRTERR